jgi:hypothetical protein
MSVYTSLVTLSIIDYEMLFCCNIGSFRQTSILIRYFGFRLDAIEITSSGADDWYSPQTIGTKKPVALAPLLV